MSGRRCAVPQLHILDVCLTCDPLFAPCRVEAEVTLVSDEHNGLFASVDALLEQAAARMPCRSPPNANACAKPQA